MGTARTEAGGSSQPVARMNWLARRRFRNARVRPIAVERLEDRTTPAPVPAVQGLAAPGSTHPLLGDPVSYSFTFANTDATATGYSPYIDLAVDTSGPDGATSNPLDGFGTPAVTAAGLSLTPVGSVTLAAGQTTYVNPFTGQTRSVPAGFGRNDTVYTYQLPFGSFTPGQSTAVTVNLPTSNLADVGTPLPLAVVPGFRDTDAVAPFTPVVGATATTDATPDLYRLKLVYLGPEDETATGPNFVRRYRLEVDVAAGQTLNNLVVTDTLAPTMQVVGRTAARMAAYRAPALGTNVFSAGSAGGTATTAAPGGTVTYGFGNVTGVSGLDAAFEFDFFVPGTPPAAGRCCRRPLPPGRTATRPSTPRRAPPRGRRRTPATRPTSRSRRPPRTTARTPWRTSRSPSRRWSRRSTPRPGR
jgi:hypothetical protein